MVGLWGGSSLIRSIQYGVVTTASGTNNQTATITAVVPENCLFFHLGNAQLNGLNNYNAAYSAFRVELTNATTATAIRYVAVADGFTYYSAFLVVEFHPGVIKSVQSGTKSLNTGGASTATITEVNASKAIVANLGFSETYATMDRYTDGIYQTLTNSTTVSFYCAGGNSGSGQICGYRVVEFF